MPIFKGNPIMIRIILSAVFLLVATLPLQKTAMSDTTLTVTKSSYAYSDKQTKRDIECLAKNIYFESRSDNLAGRYAVADVVLNRVNDRRYPGTICGVVYDGRHIESWKTKKNKKLPDSERIYTPVKNMCQFSWYCDSVKDIPKNQELWEDAQLIARNILTHNTHRGITEGATHYHATYVDPYWAKNLQQIGRIGLHIFYRWKE